MLQNKKISKYLPSKKFTLIASFIAVIFIIIFLVFFMSSSNENFSFGKKDTSPLKVENQTLTELIQSDIDGDGIPDWEEDLWGTDKTKKVTFNDTPDATYIANKKKELKIETSINETKLTETEKFAREFFTSYSAMKSSGQFDKNTINNFSNALGQKIANPNIVDQYTESDVKINAKDDLATKKEYYQKMRSAFNKYKTMGIGDELDIISVGLASGNTTNNEQYSRLPLIATAYQNFSKDVITLSVPKSLLEHHLLIANSANNTGISVMSMSKIISDPIIGLSGLSQYQKYSDGLVKSVAELETVLTE